MTNFVAMIGVPIAGMKAAAIGPITAETARDAGFEVVVAPADLHRRGADRGDRRSITPAGRELARARFQAQAYR